MKLITIVIIIIFIIVVIIIILVYELGFRVLLAEKVLFMMLAYMVVVFIQFVLPKLNVISHKV